MDPKRLAALEAALDQLRDVLDSVDAAHMKGDAPTPEAKDGVVDAESGDEAPPELDAAEDDAAGGEPDGDEFDASLKESALAGNPKLSGLASIFGKKKEDDEEDPEAE